MRAAIINILLGLWLTLSPSLLSFEKAAANNNYILGPLVITFAITAIWEVNRSVRFFNLLAGAWLVLSPFILGFESSIAILITITTGVLIMIFSLIKGTIKGNYGGGWKSLFEKHAIPANQKEN